MTIYDCPESPLPQKERCSELLIICLFYFFSVLLEAPMRTYKRQQNSVLLTVDLTRAVAEEAIQKEVSIVISYRT